MTDSEVYCDATAMGFRSWRRLKTLIGRVGSWKSSQKRCAIVRGIRMDLFFLCLSLISFCRCLLLTSISSIFKRFDECSTVQFQLSIVFDVLAKLYMKMTVTDI